MPEGFEAPKDRDPESIQGIVIWTIHRTKLWTVNANWNDDEWNLNANPLENYEWNAGNRVFSRYSRLSPPFQTGGVFFMVSFRHPPTFLPIVSISMPNEANCVLDINLFSQRICMKNLRSSIFTIATSRRGIFCLGSENEALLKAVNRSRNALSIREPSPNRSVRGIFLWMMIHKV